LDETWSNPGQNQDSILPLSTRKEGLDYPVEVVTILEEGNILNLTGSTPLHTPLMITLNFIHTTLQQQFAINWSTEIHLMGDMQ